MSNLEILKEIDKEIEICREKITEKNEEETKTMIAGIEKLLEQYQPENDIQIRIIKNRHLEVGAMKNIFQNPKAKTRKVKM